jgi:hypothetical protein
LRHHDQIAKANVRCRLGTSFLAQADKGAFFHAILCMWSGLFGSAKPGCFELVGVGIEISPGSAPVLQWCVANTKTESDAAGNRKPSKKKSTGRIDDCVALSASPCIAHADC